ncbi:CHAT domain-containing protein [Massilia sp. S19_KUP03_FR1]|uniref:CHAT domain-containing protein n=1 Tax=Massilia sp. S19_KUP03_FR1 TaxID=3025503 RepID=UPI002FCDDB3B
MAASLAGAGAGASPVFDAARARLQDAETVKALSDEGRVLYQRDRIKLAGYQYCGQAVALAERGEFRLSIQAASKALIIGQREGNDNLVASAKRDLAISYSYAGDLDHADQYARDALASGGVGTPAIAGPALKTLGDVAARRGRPADAIAHYLQAASAASAKFRPLVDIALANAYVQDGQLAQARTLYARLGAPDAVMAMPFKRGLARLRLAEGDYPGALALFTEVVDSAAGSDLSYHRLWGQAGRGEVLARIGDRAGARLAYRDAVRTSETIRSRFRSEEFKAGLFGDVQQVFDRAIALSMAEGDSAGAFALSEQSRARALLDLVRERVAMPAGAARTSPLSAAQVRAALREGEAIVAFHTLDDALIAWVVRPSGIDGYRIARTRKEVAQDVDALRQAILERRPAARALGARLYATLLAPLALVPGETLLLVPHEALHYLPFQALRTDAGYLVQLHPLAFAPSAGLALELARRSAGRHVPLAAFGNPGLDARMALPGAEREVQRIVALFTGATVFTQAAATPSQFRASVQSAGILHVAAHAEVDLVDPLQSRILLAPEGDDPGLLAARDIHGLAMDQVALVTLSACESGLGRIARGDEVLGFTRAFLSAGVASLLVSLWPVEDDSTALLMTTLYGELARGAPSAQAMQSAQLAVLAQAGYAEPYFWAAFNLVGDWRMQLAGGGAP